MRLLLRDLRFGVRTLAKTPLFTLADGLTLALGIGANTAIFTVTNALLLRPFPYHDPEQLVSIASKDAAKDDGIRYCAMNLFATTTVRSNRLLSGPATT